MFTIKGSLGYGWQKIKEHFWKLVGATACLIAAGLLSELFSRAIEKSDSAILSFVLVLGIVAIVILSIVIRIGYTKFLLSTHDGTVPMIKSIFSAYGIFWKYIWVSILQGLIMLGGFILLIVPGIIWGIKYSFAPTIVVDKGVSARAALRESSNLTKDIKLKLLGFFIVIGLVNILGYIPFGLGLLVTIPLTTLSYIYVYRILSLRQSPGQTETNTLNQGPLPQTTETSY